MSSPRTPIFDQRLPWASAAIVVLAVSVAAWLIPHHLLGMPVPASRGLGYPARTVPFEDAVARSLAGEAVIVDCRELHEREQDPVPGGAIVIPLERSKRDWSAYHDLLESLEGVDVYVIIPWHERTPRHVPVATKLKSFRCEVQYVGRR
jgi:hypothetical protein